MTFTVGLLFVGNSIFQSSTEGMKNSVRESLTADVSVSETTDDHFSIFGNEIPIVGDYAIIPPIENFDDLDRILDDIPEVGQRTAVISVATGIQINRYRSTALALGVDFNQYFRLFPRIKIHSGQIPEATAAAIMLPESRLKEIESKTKRKILPGEKILLSVFSNETFTFREVTLAGVLDYPQESEVTRPLVLIDAGTARALSGYAEGSLAGTVGNSDGQDNRVSLDSLFENAGDDVQGTTGALDLGALEKELSGSSTMRLADGQGAAKTWNFVLIRSPGIPSTQLAGSLNMRFASFGLPYTARDWVDTAGAQVQQVYTVRLLFNIGIILVCVAAILIIMNSLSISVRERTKEIGTMRAIGATRRVVSRLFMLESIATTGLFGAAGIALGSLAIFGLDFMKIRIGNPLLVELFGSGTWTGTLTVGLLAIHWLAALFFGLVASLPPILYITHLLPVRAMSRI